MKQLAVTACLAFLALLVPACESGKPDDSSSSASNLEAVLVKEMVKCVFQSKTEQECISAKGSCKGLGSCVVALAGTSGEKVEWKSSCGGYAVTIMDGLDETAEFDCGTPQPPPPPPPLLKEQVKCVFKNATTAQECYSIKGGCKGLGTCIVDVTGFKGEKVEWKSSCGGYAVTLVDGINEYASFDCATTPPPPLLKEQVKCVFKNATLEQECYSVKGACKGFGACVVDVVGYKGEKVDWKSSCGGYATTIVDGLSEYASFDCSAPPPPPPPPPPADIKEQVKCVFNNTTTTQECYSIKGGCKGIGACIVDVIGYKGEKVDWKSSCGGYATTLMDGINEYAIFDCAVPPPPPPPPPPDIKEQVKCVFKNTALVQECYSIKGGCKGIGACIVDVAGYKGEKVEWKSSCGGYAVTLIDGINDYAEFTCL